MFNRDIALIKQYCKTLSVVFKVNQAGTVRSNASNVFMTLDYFLAISLCSQ